MAFSPTMRPLADGRGWRAILVCDRQSVSVLLRSEDGFTTGMPMSEYEVQEPLFSNARHGQADAFVCPRPRADAGLVTLVPVERSCRAS